MKQSMVVPKVKWLSNSWRSFTKWVTGIVKWLSNLWGSFTKWITPVFCIGAIMVIISVVLIASHNGIFQAAGTAMLAAGLTIITTTLTSRESISQQFAKEANITRKYTIYGPLFIELKQIYEWLDEARRKEGPYPYYIYGAGGEPESTRYSHNPIYPTFLQWPQFKEDYRIDSFTPNARTLLNDVQRLIADYNRAMGATYNPAIVTLTPHVEKAIITWMESGSFKEWDKRNSESQTWQSGPEHNWNYILKTSLAGTDMSDMSMRFTTTWVGPFRGLGWLIAGDGNKTALYIQGGYNTQGNMTGYPPISWLEEIINEAWPELDTLQEIKEARVVAEALRIRVQEAEGQLEAGIRLIRDQYEGGEPHV